MSHHKYRAGTRALAALLAATAVAGCERDEPLPPAPRPDATVTVQTGDVVQTRGSMNGFLHSLSATEPRDALVAPLAPRLWRSDLTRASPERARALGARYLVVLSDLWGYPKDGWNGRGPPWANLRRWERFVRATARGAARPAADVGYLERARREGLLARRAAAADFHLCRRGARAARRARRGRVDRGAEHLALLARLPARPSRRMRARALPRVIRLVAREPAGRPANRRGGGPAGSGALGAAGRSALPPCRAARDLRDRVRGPGGPLLPRRGGGLPRRARTRGRRSGGALLLGAGGLHSGRSGWAGGQPDRPAPRRLVAARLVRRGPCRTGAQLLG